MPEVTTQYAAFYAQNVTEAAAELTRQRVAAAVGDSTGLNEDCVQLIGGFVDPKPACITAQEAKALKESAVERKRARMEADIESKLMPAIGKAIREAAEKGHGGKSFYSTALAANDGLSTEQKQMLFATPSVGQVTLTARTMVVERLTRLGFAVDTSNIHVMAVSW